MILFGHFCTFLFPLFRGNISYVATFYCNSSIRDEPYSWSVTTPIMFENSAKKCAAKIQKKLKKSHL